MLIIPWVIWVIFRKKESSSRFIHAAFILIIMTLFLDLIGVLNGYWVYPIKIFPPAIVFFPFQISVLPVLLMFFLQIKPTISPYIKALIFGFILAYICMPIMKTLHFYKPIHWKYTYSFIILIVIYLVAHWFGRASNFEEINKGNEQVKMIKSESLRIFRRSKAR
nr:CBO0543 family protein [Paenibacillus sp. SYP-B3998]